LPRCFGISPAASQVPIGGRGLDITIPRVHVLVAVLYSGIGSVIAHLIGRPLTAF